MRDGSYDPARPVVVVSYAAKSTADEHGSIESQFEQNRAHAELQGWVIVNEFRDEAASAYKSSRGEGLMHAKTRAAELAADGADVVLLVYASDRLARGDGVAAAHLVEHLFDARKADYRLAAVTESLDDLPTVALLGERSHLDSKAKSAHTRRGKRAAAERGKRNGGPRPYGYEHRVLGVDDRRKPITQLTVVTFEAKVIRRVFSEFVDGVSQSEIARGLARDGIKTTRGGAWGQSQIGALLKSRLYLGEVSYRGEWFRGEHEPIVPLDLFESAQRLLRGALHRGGRPAGEPFLLGGGLMKCECGATMRVRSEPRPDKWKSFYRCLGRDSGSSPDCRMPAIARQDVDEAVFAYFERVALDHNAVLAALDLRQEQEQSIIGGQLEQCERDYVRAGERLARVKRDYQDGRLDPDDWREQRAELGDELEAAEQAVERLRRRERELADEVAGARVQQQGLDALATFRAAVAGNVIDAGNVEAARNALRTVFASFVLHRQSELSDCEDELWDADDELRFRNVVDAGLVFDGGDRYLEPVPRDDAIVRPWKLDEGGCVEQLQQLRRVGMNTSSEPPESSP